VRLTADTGAAAWLTGRLRAVLFVGWVVTTGLANPGAAATVIARELSISQLEAEVAAGEDISAVKRLQRAYGYYLDKGMWEDLSAFFTDDAVANYPAGVFIGKDSIRQHLYMNVGGGKMGDIGLGDGRVYNHMNIQPVVHLDPGGKSAKGRWRAFAMFGSFGGAAVWAEGVYEIGYAKDNGVWKIKTLDYYSGYGSPFETGWAPPAPAVPAAAGQPTATGSSQDPPRGSLRKLAHAPDRERNRECDGFAAACVPPFHYENPSTPEGGAVWRVQADPPVTDVGGEDRERLANLLHRVTRLRDEQQIENLQRIYGYYLDRAQWDQVTDLFASDATIELDQRGVYVGKRHIRRFLDLLGPEGLQTGWLNDHLQMQILVDVSPDGRTARSRSRELGMTGKYGGTGVWSEGVYENTFVKQDGVWKFKSVHFYPTLITAADKGWGKDAQPAPPASITLPPDRPPSEIYEIFPKAHVPPYHYLNPVTGKPPQYPAVGGPSPELAAAKLLPSAEAPRMEHVTNISDASKSVHRMIDRVKDYDEIENLESAYGYYLDKNLWNQLADLFATDGSIELAQRGVYQGRDRVRAFLLQVFGRGTEGPVAGHLGNHIQIQPVITVAEDGLSARIRTRLLQQMSFGSHAMVGGAVYENVAVKEGGVWKLKVDHAYNTFTAGYEGGWAKSANRFLPGPSPDFAADAPPTLVFNSFPSVYEIPYHYANPVSGRIQLHAIGTGAMPSEIETALRDIGPRVEGQRTAALYAPLQPKEPYQGVSVARDVSYGWHERHVLDVFTAAKGLPKASGKPVVVFIHGGGFTMGAKRSAGSPFYDNIGLWAVTSGFVGVTINYRLAPDNQFPSGVEDLTALTSWLRQHIAEYGGDPTRLFFWGHSAGAAHVADYLAHAVKVGIDPGIAGAILTSGFYDLGDKVSIWKAYYGDDVSKYADRSSLPFLAKTRTPLLVTDAELDPDSFRAETDALRAVLAKAGKPVRSVHLRGHSHVSETYAVGSGDESLSEPVREFILSVRAVDAPKGP
jgi:acetyl esterase/lipase